MFTNNNKQRNIFLFFFIISLGVCLFWVYSRSYSDAQKEILQPRKDVKEQPLCTFAIFRRYNAEQHYFPSGGEWTTTWDIPHYKPHICRYEYPRVPEQLLEKCFNKTRLRSVLITGDSTGRRNYVAIVKSVGEKCQAIKDNSSDSLFDRGAITGRPSAFGFTKIDYRSKCNLLSENRTIYFERMEHSHMPTTQLNVKSLSPAKSYPDIYLIFLPFFHVKRQPIKTLRKRIKVFMAGVKHVIPQSARIVFFNRYSEFESARRGKSLKFLNRRYENMLAAEKIFKMNHIFYGELEKDLLKTNSRIYSFLDLFNMSLGRDEWCKDGVHMLPDWHDSIMSMFWQTYCNSIFLDEF